MDVSLLGLSSQPSLTPETIPSIPSADFGINGLITKNISQYVNGDAYEQGFAGALQSDGKLIIGGSSDITGYSTPSFIAARINIDGTVDTSFASDGFFTRHHSSGSYDSITTIKVQADGKILLGGYTSSSGLRSFLLLRLNSNGSLDSNFGAGTGVVTAARSGYVCTPHEIILQPDGKILLIGQSFSAGTNDVLMFRFNTDGSLDASFGSGGMVITDKGINDVALGAALQADGKILVTGYSSFSGTNDFFLFRYESDGDLDPTFGTGGMSLTDIAGSSNDLGHKVALQSDGKIVVVGLSWIAAQNRLIVVRYLSDGSIDTSYGSSGKTQTAGSYGSELSLDIQPDDQALVGTTISTGNSNFIALRYATTGVLDASFGTGGITNYDFASSSWDQGNFLLRRPDGKILIGGTTDAGGSYDLAAILLADNGVIDTTFGSSGKVNIGTPIYQLSDDEILGMALQSDGKVLAGGRTNAGSSEDFTLVRFNIDGSLDTNFGTGGSITKNFGGNSSENAVAVAELSDGKILVAGYSDVNGSNDVVLVRYTSVGDIDTSFGYGNGYILYDLSSSSDDLVSALRLQSDGKILIAGSTDAGSLNDFFVLRLNSDGSRDSSFGNLGLKTIDFDNQSEDLLNSLAIQSDGKLLIAGRTTANGSSDIAVVRLETTGNLDTSFATGGKLIADIGSGSSDIANQVAELANGKIAIAGTTNTNGSPDMLLAQFTSGGTLDSSFGVGGKFIYDFDTNSDSARALVIKSSGTFVLVGSGEIQGNEDLALVGVSSNGVLDTTFGTNGSSKLDIGGAYESANSAILHPNGSFFVGGDRTTYNQGEQDMILAKYQPDGTR